MKIYIIIDLEGITGVVSPDKQAKPGSSGYQEARELLMSDLNAAIEGALEGGASEILIYDMHYHGLNVILSKLHPKAKIIMGNPHIVPPEMGLNNTFKGMFMIGFHAMAETEEALLSHTYSHDMKALYLNGVLMGEIGMEAAIAGTYDVPLIMISGDSKGIEEGEKILKNLGKPETATVKYAVSEGGAVCFPPSVARDIIRRKAESAVKRINEFKPYQPKPSGDKRNRYVVDLDFYKQKDREKALDRAKRAGKNNICQGAHSGAAIVLEGNDLPSLWKGFTKMYQE